MTGRTHTVRELVEEASCALQQYSSTPRLDAELLMAHLLGGERIAVTARALDPMDAELVARYLALIERRRMHEPVAYIVGFKEFYGLSFEVGPGVLVPRPETELLIEHALDSLGAVHTHAEILDLGTGSGCIAVALSYELSRRGRHAQITAIDKDPAALTIAARNAARCGVAEKISFLQSDWFEQLRGGSSRYDLILSNPPYVPDDSGECSPELQYEPSHALFAGATGLDAILHLVSGVREYLKQGGTFLCEIGHDQRAALEAHLTARVRAEPFPLDFSFHRDLAGRDRMLRLSFAAR